MHVLHLADVEKLQSVYEWILKELDHGQNLRSWSLLGVLVQKSRHSFPKWYRYQWQKNGNLIVKLVQKAQYRQSNDSFQHYFFTFLFYFSIKRSAELRSKCHLHNEKRTVLLKHLIKIQLDTDHQNKERFKLIARILKLFAALPSSKKLFISILKHSNFVKKKKQNHHHFNFHDVRK